MFSIIFPIVLILIGVTLIATCIYLLSEWGKDFPAAVCMVLGVVVIALSIPTVVNGISYVSYTLNPQAYTANVEETRESYIILLDKYEKLSEQDITSSSTYSELYKNICDFNHEVYRAQAHAGDNFMAGFLYNPAYSTVDPIPLQP